MTSDHSDFDVDAWMAALLDRLRLAFGDRLLCVGLQGSHRRGEQTPDSDIDAVVVLDALTPDDLKAYRAIVDSLPCSEKACGFVGGARELRNWPRHELFHFRNDTRVLYGNLDRLLPIPSMDDIRDAVRFGAAGLYHQAAHLAVHGDPESRPRDVAGLCKQARFVMQALHFLRRGEFLSTRSALLPKLGDDERKILKWVTAPDEMDGGVAESADEALGALVTWSAGLLAEYGSEHG